MEIGENIWLEAARKWQGLLAANVRAEAIQVRAEIVDLKIEIMSRFPKTYKRICSSAYRKGTKNQEIRIPQERFISFGMRIPHFEIYERNRP